jgi:lactobin A/cerein 7B family class IIb bacteriocin
MVLTGERAEKLSNYLNSDIERAKKLVDLPAEEALALINADNNDFTIEELKDFRDVMELIAKEGGDGELQEEELATVSGGIVISGAVLAAGVALFTAGVTFGYTVARDRGW